MNLKDMISKHIGDDGKVDIDGLTKAIDTDYVNPIIAKKKPDMEKLEQEALGKAYAKIIGDLGIDTVKDIDGLKAYAKKIGATTDETKEALLRVEKERDASLSKYSELESKYNGLNSNYTNLERKSIILENGFNPKYVNAILAETSSKVTEEMDFAKALEDTKSNYPEWVIKQNQSAGGGKTPLPDNNNEEWGNTKAKTKGFYGR